MSCLTQLFQSRTVSSETTRWKDEARTWGTRMRHCHIGLHVKAKAEGVEELGIHIPIRLLAKQMDCAGLVSWDHRGSFHDSRPICQQDQGCAHKDLLGTCCSLMLTAWVLFPTPPQHHRPSGGTRSCSLQFSSWISPECLCLSGWS